jgi:hypothetical protein
MAVLYLGQRLGAKFFVAVLEQPSDRNTLAKKPDLQCV